MFHGCRYLLLTWVGLEHINNFSQATAMIPSLYHEPTVLQGGKARKVRKSSSLITYEPQTLNSQSKIRMMFLWLEWYATAA